MEETGGRVSSGMGAGRLEGVSLPDLLWELCRSRTTGVLELTRRGIRKSVYVQAGSIVFAASGDPNDRLGELLLREGLVTLDQLETAIARLGTGKRLGTLLVEAGHLTSDNLVRAVVHQVRDIVLGLFVWEEGEYVFREGPLPSDEVITLQMRTGEILLQGIGCIRSFARIRRSVGPPRTMYRLRQDPGTGQEIEAVTLSEGAVLLLGRLERGSESVEALCSEMFLSNFEIYQTLWAFKVLGVIEEVEPRVHSQGAALEGRLAGPDGLAGVLVSLSRAAETGVVHVVRGTRERSFHLKAGACIFATSNDIDDGLVAHLLRRGVISLRDREEVAKRLLSNKRVGTILLEMGVLDETDLRAMVCEQLSEVVYDTIRWEDGEFVFVPGDLPTFEDITLSDSIEDLVAAALRRITAWSRVQAGCGGPDAVLGLTPEYLGILDRMRLAADAWEVTSALKQPRSVREICRATQVSSFRACQILWTLRLLGAVTFTSADATSVQGAAETAVASAAEAFSLVPEEEATPIEVAAPPEEETVLQIAAEATRWIPDVAEENRVLPVATDETSSEEAVLQIAAEATRWIPDAAEENGMLPLARGEAASEVLHGLWRLAAEKAPDQPMRAEEPSEDVGEPEAPETHEAVEEPGPEPAPVEALPNAEAMEAPAEPTAGALAFAEDIPQAAEDPGTTMQLSRDEVEAALASRPDPPPPGTLAEPDTAAFDAAPLEGSRDEGAPPEPAPLLDADLTRFNARQRLVYRSIRAEVGAGAANFVRSCRTDLFAQAELAPDGTWDVDLLRRTLAKQPGETAPEAFDRLLEAQIDRLTQHIGPSRAEALREQIRKL